MATALTGTLHMLNETYNRITLFQETLKLAKEADSNFNGVLCGRATWKDSVEIFGKDQEEAKKWLETRGKENIQTLNEVLKETAHSVFEKIEE